MDYGKLAYLKAVDLENRLGVSGKSGFTVSVIELRDLPSGTCDVAEISGRGDVAVFIVTTENATFYANGVRICEGKDVFFKLEGGGKVTAESSGIAKLRLIALGDVAVAERPGSLAADENESEIAYVICEQGRADAFTLSKDSLQSQLLFSGDYLSGDVCAHDGSFTFAFINIAGTVILRRGDAQQSFYLGADKVAITADEFAFTVAFTKGGELYYFELGKIGDSIRTIDKVNFSGFIDDVRFVKKSNKLLFSSGGKCFVKDLGDKPGGKDCVRINLTAEVL